MTVTTSPEAKTPGPQLPAPRKSRCPALLSRPLLSRWIPGPAGAVHRDVLISVTQYSPRRFRDTPGVYLTGTRLRMGWYAMPGAVGLWLWALPWARRSGAISVWQSEADLRRFVQLPLHRDVMRRYRQRGTLASTSWSSERFIPAIVLDDATHWIMSGD